MKKQHNTRICAKSPKRNRGFSTLEILVATVLIGTLVAGGIYYANIGQKVNSVELVALKTAVVVRFPEAIATIYSNKLSLANTTAANLVSTGSVQENQPVTWAVSSNVPTKTEIGLVFTLGTAAEATDLETYLNDNLNTTLVKTVTVDDANITVRYEIS